MQRDDFGFELDDFVIEPEEEVPTGPGWDLEDEMLLRLHQVSISNRRSGGPDQGFPKLSQAMEAKGLLVKRGPGWFVTTEGQEIIRAQRQRLKRI